MFVIVCKESGCVKLISSSNPRETLELAPDLEDHFDIKEFNDENNYTGKFLKVVDNTLVDLGFMLDLEASGQIQSLGCDDCPPMFRI
jgi:hypothetical protein